MPGPEPDPSADPSVRPSGAPSGPPPPPPNPEPRPTQTGAFPQLWIQAASLALAATLALGLFMDVETVASLRAPELVASRQVERPIELLDGLEFLAAEAGAPGGSGLPEEWRGYLLEAGIAVMQEALGDVEAVAREKGQLPPLPKDPDGASEGEPDSPDASTGNTSAGSAGPSDGPPAPEQSGPEELDWTAEALRLRLKLAALLHLRGDRGWRQALDADFTDPEQRGILSAARAILQRAPAGDEEPARRYLDGDQPNDEGATERGQPVGEQAPSTQGDAGLQAGSDTPSAQDDAEGQAAQSAANEKLGQIPEGPAELAPTTEPSARAARPPQGQADQARRFDALGEGLAGSHLRRLAAEAAGLSELASDVKQRYREQARDRAELLAARFGLGILLFGLGAVFLVCLPFLGRARLLLAPGSGPSGSFGLADGWAVWVLYALSYQLLLALAGPLDPDQKTGLLVPLCSLPLIGLVHGVVARRSGRGTLDLLGLRLLPGRFGRLILFALGAWVLTLVGVYAISASPLGTVGGGSWANPVLDLLVRSDAASWRGLNQAAGLWAPIFEEIGYRGVLFAGLRSQMRFLPAAAISSLLFGLSHSYGLPGNLLIAWVGFVLCWSYERTRSLFPGILLHSLFNLGQLSMMGLLR